MGRGVLLEAMVLGSGSRLLLALGDGTFGAKSQFESTDLHAGGGPMLAAGDFNRDGKLDLVANMILLQDPRDRTVWNGRPFSEASGIYFFRAADCDGDGDEDLLGAAVGSATYFFRAKGDGSFAPAVRVAGSYGPRWLTVADLDGDGDLDFATADQLTGPISVFLGGGKGTFSLSQNVVTGGRSHSVEALDFDGDGKPDLAAGTTSGIEILKRSDAGPFKLQLRSGIPGFCYHSLAIGDFNGDGLEDLASPCAVGISQGDGAFRLETLAGFDFTSVAAADLDGDALEDVIYPLSWGIAVHRGSGDGRFGPPFLLGPARASTYYYGAALLAADLDGDHHTDLVAPDLTDSALSILWGKADGPLQSSLFGFSGFGPVKTMAIGDVDADGVADLLLPRAGQPKIDAYLLAPVRAGLVRTNLAIDAGYLYTSLEMADLDGDGGLDLAGATYTGEAALVALLEPGGKVRSRTSMATGRYPAAVGLGRFGGDGAMDLVLPCSGSSGLAVFEGLGGGTFAQAKVISSIIRPKDLALADLDGDARLDAAVISTEEVGVHFGAGGVEFGEPVTLNRNEARRYQKVAIADLGGDGLPDLITLERNLGLLAFRAAGGRAFQAANPVPVAAGDAVSLACADLDGDGLTDVTVTSTKPPTDGITPEASLTVLLERGAGFGPHTGYPLPFVPLGQKLADLDQDGALDLVAYSRDTVLVLFGNAAAPAAELFRRGDADGDGAMELTDAIAVLDRLFLGGEALRCPDAADANDDGEIDLTDPIAILSRLFSGGDALPPPGTDRCEVDPTPDGLGHCPRDC